MSARDTVTTDTEYDGSAQRHIDIEHVDAITGMTEGTPDESLVDDLPASMDLFGFTGTPIFADNASSSGNPKLRTTEQAFGDKLHTYTIVDAIRDGNVLPFRVDYIQTIKKREGLPR